jgi:hypothetical protein
MMHGCPQNVMRLEGQQIQHLPPGARNPRAATGCIVTVLCYCLSLDTPEVEQIILHLELLAEAVQVS